MYLYLFRDFKDLCRRNVAFKNLPNTTYTFLFILGLSELLECII